MTIELDILNSFDESFLNTVFDYRSQNILSIIIADNKSDNTLSNSVIKITEFALDNVHIGTFLIAILTFIITFSNFYRNRASIEIIQFPESHATIIKPDRIDAKTPDVYWHNDYRLIIDVTITNKSAKPISIIEFVINDKMKFNSYHSPGELYQITIRPRDTMHNGVTFSGQPKVGRYTIGESWIQPILDIPPFTSIRGHLFFHFPDEDMVKVGKNELKIITSRKTFIKDLKLNGIQKSALPLPNSIAQDRTRNF